MQTEPTVKTDIQTRVVAFTDKDEATEEVKAWRADGHKARIIFRKGVYNVLSS